MPPTSATKIARTTTATRSATRTRRPASFRICALTSGANTTRPTRMPSPWAVGLGSSKKNAKVAIVASKIGEDAASGLDPLEANAQPSPRVGRRIARPGAAPLRQQPVANKTVNVLGARVRGVLEWHHGSTANTPRGGRAGDGIGHRARLRAQGAPEQVGAAVRAAVAAGLAAAGAGGRFYRRLARRSVAEAAGVAAQDRAGPVRAGLRRGARSADAGALAIAR